MSITKKIISIATVVGMLAPIAPALAITAADLQVQIDALLAQLSSLQAQLTTLEGGETTPTVSGCTITSFDRSLKVGSSGEDVKCLQIILNSAADTQVAATGVGSSGSETTYFGPLTQAAAIKFQEKYASEVLASWGLTTGTGFIGSTSRTKLNSLLGAGVPGTPGTPGEVGTTAAVSLAADTAVAGAVAKNSQDVPFTKIRFSAGATAYTVTQIVVARGGVSADADISSIKLYDGTAQLGSTQALNTNTHKATFGSLSWEIPSYTVKYLSILGSIAASPTVGDVIQLGISAASDISATVSPSGTFPIMGNLKTVAGISVGRLDVDKQATPATTTVLSGATDQEVACWKFTADNTEGFDVNSIKVSHVGSAARADLSNLVLKVSGTQIGSTMLSLDASNQVMFDLSASPLNIRTGSAKTVCSYTDVASGISTSRTAIFELTQATNIVAYGANSGGIVTVTITSATFVKQTGNTMTIGQGTLTVALDAAQNPAAQNYVKGTANRLITAVKFSTGAREGVRMVKLVFTLGGTGSATDISNVTLWDGTTQIAGPASVIGTSVTFGANTIGYDVTGLFDVLKSANTTVLVKADVPTGADSTKTVSLSLSAASDISADGLGSQYDLPSSAITGTATGNAHSVTANGTLSVALAADTPPAQTYVKGSTAKSFTKINFTAGSGEDMTVTSITVRCYVGSGTGSTCASGDVTNVKLLKSDGSQFGSVVTSPTASAGFSGTFTVTAAQTGSITVVADIPTTAAAASVHFDLPGAGTVASDITSTGASSAADITETGSATGKLVTIGSGSLTIAAAAVPADQTQIIGATQIPIVGLVLTAGTGEDVRITKLKFTRSVLTSSEGSSTDLSNIAIYDGSTRLTANKPWDGTDTEVTFTASDFLNLLGIDIVKGQQKTVTVNADVPSTAVNLHVVAIGIATSTDPGSTTTSDVTIVGLSSNTSPAPTVTKANTALEGANYSSNGDGNAYYLTLNTKGTLTVASAADTPGQAIQSVGSQGYASPPTVSFYKASFSPTLEASDVKSITVERSGGRDSDFSSITIWDGTTQLGTAQSLVNASTTFSFVAGSYWRIDAVKNLTVKGVLNGIRLSTGSGSETGDAPQLGVDNITAEGVSSGLSPTGAGQIDLLGNAQHLRQSQPTIALASPVDTTIGGTKQLIRWTVTADGTDDIAWKKVILDVSGAITVATVSNTVGCISGDTGCTGKTDGIYTSTSSDIGVSPTQLIATSSMKIYDVGSGSAITATTTDTAWTVDQSTSPGTARVAFVAAAEQTVAAGTTKTYYLEGAFLQGGAAGDSITTRINTRPTSATSDTYVTVAGTTGTFIWSDKSGASSGNAHSSLTADWTHDYKVSGLPTSVNTLTK